MICLAIETTGTVCAVGLRRPGFEDLIEAPEIGRGHAEKLAPMVDALLSGAGIQASQIDRIGVAIGPGSFAGTRVGVAFARGLALACGADVVGLSNLAAIAHEHHTIRPLVVAHDARRDELILQIYQGAETTDPIRLTVDELPAWLGRQDLAGARVAGSGSSVLAMPSLPRADHPDMTALLDLTMALDPTEHPASPFYARPPDAKLPGGVDV